MQRRILLTLFAVTAMFGQQAAQKADAPKAKTLTRAEFDALLANPSSVLVIDVRRPDELTAKGGFPVYLSI